MQNYLKHLLIPSLSLALASLTAFCPVVRRNIPSTSSAVFSRYSMQVRTTMGMGSPPLRS